MFRLEFTVDGLPPNLVNGSHRNWRAAAGIRRTWKMRAVEAIGNQKPEKPLEKARVSCFRHSSRCPDYEGLIVTFKPIIDALTVAGIIRDDSMDVIGRPDYQHVKAKAGEGFVRVVVEEISA